MKRSTSITWDELKVGLLILVAAVVIAIAIVQLGQAANLFAKRYPLVTFLPNANGLREGNSVTIAGQLAGIVTRIQFLPPDGDTTRNIEVVMAIDEQLAPQVREDSRVSLRTLGLLGDKVLDISPGTPRYPVLAPDDTIPATQTLDYEQVIAQAAGTVGDLTVLTHDLRSITGEIVRGEGTMGQLITNRTLYDQLSGTLTQMNQVLARMQNPNGTFGRLIDDPTLYNRLTSATTRLDSLLVAMQSPQGTLGKLLYDDTLYTRMVSASAAADSVLHLMTQGNGFAARLLTDQELYDQLNKSLTDLNTILEDVRQHPNKYTKGLVKIF
ncbi:MAG TPA: MlaD family protein [Gemmatimonadaceae bacterium]|jgi:phospholipid/cholesterol/gamma-HCH transport system substrate-binding protein|nr:MlaD family protein [Gemmatimonadaceae bacterium]